MAQRSKPEINLRQFWFGVAGPTAVWVIHFASAYAVQSVSCHWGFLQSSLLGITGLRLLLVALTVAAGALILWGGWSLYQIHLDLSRRATGEIEDPSGRVRFMARAGSWLAALYLFSLFLMLFPLLTLEPCGAYWW